MGKLYKEVKRVIAVLLASVMVLPAIPFAGGETAVQAAGTKDVIYDYESDAGAESFDGSKAGKEAAAFTGSTDWGTDQVSFVVTDSFGGSSLEPDSKLSFDLKLPGGTTFNGVLKAQGVAKMGDSWSWTQCDAIPELNIGDFQPTADGNLGTTVTFDFSAATIYDASGNGSPYGSYTGSRALKEVILNVIGYGCNLNSAVYCDNITLESGTSGPTDTILYQNDFESETSAVDFGGSKALRRSLALTGSSSWEDTGTAFEITESFTGVSVTTGSAISCKLKLPSGTAFPGGIKVRGVVQLDDAWLWVQSNTIPELKETDFKAANGVLEAEVTIPFSDATCYGAAETPFTDYDGAKALKRINIGIFGNNCTLNSDIYLDDLKLTASSGGEEPPTVSPYIIDFDTVTGSWAAEAGYQYTGDTVIASGYPEINGSRTLSVGLDYSKDSSYSWSEAKVKCYLPEARNLYGYNNLSMDLYYNPAGRQKGSFKLKVYTNYANGSILDKNVDVPAGIPAAGGLYKSKVSIDFVGENSTIDGMTIGFVGVNTDYTGNIYLDNLTFAGLTKPDGYVDSTIALQPQARIEVSGNSVSGVAANTAINLADDEAEEYVSDLYAYLEALGKTDSVIFGHQNDIHHKTGSRGSGFTNSDTKDVTGSISGVVGIDALSLTGNELGSWDQTQAERVDACARMTKEAADQGAIITLSAHMPNFEVIRNRIINAEPGSSNQEKVGYLSDGSINFSGYTPGTLTGNIVERIIPGGDLNDLYNAYLDLIAQYADACAQYDIPIMFRPFHENTGSWFWWGAAFCDAEEYKTLYRYTVDYLRDTKNIHNILYVYGPSSEAESAAEYAKRYPGDDYVDMVGFDMYHSSPAADDGFFANFAAEVQVVEDFADAHGKLFAVTETGVANGSNALLKSGNEVKDWYNQVLDVVSASEASYFLLWANFGESSGFYTPYVISRNPDGTLHGHEMLDNFIDFYNDGRSVFANEMGDYKALVTATIPNDESGYFYSPASGSRVLAPTVLSAFVDADDPSKSVSYRITNAAGSKLYEADITAAAGTDLAGGRVDIRITQNILNIIGKQSAAVTLAIGGKDICTINIKFNMEAPATDPLMVDDFESYYGETGQLTVSWTAQKGTGNISDPRLTSAVGNYNRKTGDYGLALNMRLISGGYIGITKDMKGVDWSSANALQFWTKPDGKNQKVVIQITSGSNVFEVYLNEYPDYTDKTDTMLVTVPFTAFTGRDNAAAVFDASNIASIGLWVNAIGTEGFPLDSTIYYDDIKAVASSVSGVTFTKLTEESPGGSNSGSNPSTPEVTPGDDSQGQDIVISEASTVVTGPKDKSNEVLSALIRSLVSSVVNQEYIAIEVTSSVPEQAAARIRVSGLAGVKPGDIVYLYVYNKETGMLERLNRTKYTVGEDGYIDITVTDGLQYVILKEEVKGEKVLTRADQTAVRQTAKVGTGKKSKLSVTIKEEFKKYAKVSYRSNNPDIVKVSGDGTITGQKKGKAKITVTVSFGRSVRRITVTVTVS